MPLSFMNAISASRGMRRKRLPGTRKPLQPAAVEAADDRLLRDLADLRRLAGGEYGLHSCPSPSLCVVVNLGQMVKGGSS